MLWIHRPLTSSSQVLRPKTWLSKPLHWNDSLWRTRLWVFLGGPGSFATWDAWELLLHFFEIPHIRITQDDTHTHTYTYIYLYTIICVYTFMYIYTYIHTYMFILWHVWSLFPWKSVIHKSWGFTCHNQTMIDQDVTAEQNMVCLACVEDLVTWMARMWGVSIPPMWGVISSPLVCNLSRWG